MSKRKRESEDDSEVDENESAKRERRAQGRRLESVLERSKQTLCKALKLARGFERQKLGRRQRTAKAAKDDGGGKRLAAEVEALKTNSIASAPVFPASIRSKLNERAKPQDAAHTNTQARLFNSQPVKKALNDCMGDIRASIGLDDAQGGKRKRMRKTGYQSQPPENGNGKNSKKIHGDSFRLDDDPTSKASFTDGARLQENDQASSSDEGIDYEVYNTRLVGSSDDSFDGFSEVPEPEELHTISRKVTPGNLSLSPSLDSSESAMLSKHPLLGSTRALEKPTTNAKATRFLPSLMMGGYWSGSEPRSDDEGNLNELQRKNRRGQRERRLIAEKKYGQNANHLKKQKNGNDRDRGWDARRGAQASNGRGNRGRGRGGTIRVSQAARSTKKGAASSSGANSDPIGTRRTVGKGKPAGGPLHPSWQAAKSAKEKSATFQGKKVLFG
ncbi:MAG: hypothetical protein Q9225_005933 [Loekoesia sp. 1 TL-2023]